jgi:uncharacterized protein with HEPN domain
VRHEATRGRLEGVRVAAEDILAFTAELGEADFAALPDADRRTFRALKDALIEIGEVVNELPPDLLARHPSVDWRGWAGLRDVVSQQRFGPELGRLQPAVADELPALLLAVKTELGRSADGQADGQAIAPGG